MSSSETPVIETMAGAVRGTQHEGGSAYLSIPFAAPPTGARRFLAPQPPEKWSGVRSCDSYGATPQRRPFADTTAIPDPTIGGDDTLSVSVFTPAAGDSGAALPVLVWVHGGAYFSGSPASPWYDGRSFSRDGVVTVVISYRLGFDGYGWIEGAPLNRGVLDQIAALEWVRDNIRGFGGDPQRVTIAGQSAGAGSALTLLGSPRAQGLFHRVISQSGAVSALSVPQAEQIGRAFADALGIAPTLTGWRSVTEDQVLDLERDYNHAPSALPLTASAEQVIEGLRRDPASSLHFAFAPVIDGETVVSVAEAIVAGRARGVSLLLGANADEVGVDLLEAVDVEEIVAALRAAGVSEASVDRYRLKSLRLDGGRFGMGQLISAYVFRAQAPYFAGLRAEFGGGERTWLYEFAHRSTVSGYAGHCDELPFVWDVLDAEGVLRELGGAPPQSLATQMHADWVRFISDGELPWQPVAVTRFGAHVYGGDVAYDENAYRLEAELTLNAHLEENR